MIISASRGDFEYGGRSTRSEVKSVTLSDNHTPIIMLLENLFDIKVSGSLFLICVYNNMILFWT